MIHRPIVVTCDLASKLAGDPPPLDSLLTMRAALLSGRWRECSRQDAAPPVGEVPIPVAVTRLGAWPVAHCSSPIFRAESDVHGYYIQRFPQHCADLLHPDHVQQINTTGGVMKAARLPNRERLVGSVSWIVEGNWREMRKLLRDVEAIGKDVAMGYGVVAKGSWRSVERSDLAGAWWYAPRGSRVVLMRPMPIGDWLPGNMDGAMQSFGAVCTPYWHPERFTEIVTPC